MKQSNGRLVFYTCNVTLLLAPPSIWAQVESQGAALIESSPTTPAHQSTANSDAAIPEIIVTAQKRSERLQDVPMSIAAATALQLQSLDITNTDQLSEIVPGLTYDKTIYGLPVLFIRGIGFNDTTLGVAPAVTVYQDQVPVPYAAMTRGAILDLERVEVLKGPQGTLFGENSTGGAINYIVAKPTDTLQGGGTLTYGRFNEIDTEAFISGPIANTLTARLAVRTEYEDAWQTGYTTQETVGEKQFRNARLLLDWKPADATRFEFQVTGWQDHSETQQQQLVEFYPQGTTPLPYPIATFPTAPNNARVAAWDPGENYRKDDNFFQVALRADVELSDKLALASLTSYENFHINTPQDFAATVYPLSFIHETGSISTFFQELRLSGSNGDRVKWMVGGNYEHDDIPEVLIFNPNFSTTSQIGPIDVSAFDLDNDQTVSTVSGFGSLDFKLSDTLTLQGSTRYTSSDRSFAGCGRDSGNGELAAAFSILSTVLTGAPQVIAPGACATLGSNFKPLPIVDSKLDQDNVSWRASLNWQPDPRTLLYFNVTKGYKAGSFPTYPAAFVSQLNPVPQESVLAFEAGFKLESPSRMVQLNGAAFYYDYEDKQLDGFLVVPPFGSLPSLVSIPKARVAGGELNLVLHPVEGLQLTAGGTYVDSRVTRNPPDPTGPFGTMGGSFVGQSFPYAPNWQGDVDAEYRLPVASSLFAFVGANGSSRSGTTGALLSGVSGIATQESLLKIHGYTLLDLRAGLEPRDGPWRVEIWGRNVTNKFYVVGTTRASDYVTRYAGMPVTYGVSVRYRFGH
jgi:outer membrane receptor protein involved in Fe transport